MKNKIELLAPAGDLEKLKIAILYGADAVFVGSTHFSLRSRASNFTMEDLKEGANFCHRYGKKLYVTMNIVPHNTDLIGFMDYVQDIEKTGVDAIICTSLAMMDTIKKHTNLEIHVSTQQSVLNSYAVNFFDQLGVQRVVLGRELSLTELLEIRKNTKIELEVFIHGGMCVSYSGRCMLSNNMTNRDANRGGCAHSCRWNYRLYQGEEELKAENCEFFAMSSKDLMTVRHIHDLIKIGISSLKIEGRMKSLHYIATVVKTYRTIIDAYYYNTPIDFDACEAEIRKAENRLTSHGWMLGETTVNEQLYSMRSEIPTQQFVGIIKEYNQETRKALVEVRNHFKPYAKLELFSPNQDTVEFMIHDIVDQEGNQLDAARHPKQLVYIDCPDSAAAYDMLRVVNNS